MHGLPVLNASDTPRVRRWDAVVLGGALPGLVMAVVLMMRGARVLLVEEDTALTGFAGLREPFLLSGAGSRGILGVCLREIGIPLIERRGIVSHPTAYQVVLPDARLDVGDPARTIEEIVAWGLAKPEEAQALVRALAHAATAEREAMLRSPVVRMSRRLPTPLVTALIMLEIPTAISAVMDSASSISSRLSPRRVGTAGDVMAGAQGKTW
ncbi:MAG: hypothetical protein IH804_01795 [Planctomycetes bacterium]|nr:hypothetical protein [Planctomycetota bacterium]